MRNSSSTCVIEHEHVHVCVCKRLTETPLFCASSHHGWCDGDIRPSPHLNPHPKGNSPSPSASLRPGNQPETHRRHMLYNTVHKLFWNCDISHHMACDHVNKVQELKRERKESRRNKDAIGKQECVI